MNDSFNLPPVSIPDLQAGGDYLAQLQLANPVLAEQQLMAFLEALLADPPDSGVLFSLLEQARVPMCFVEEEMARHYQNKPLPLADGEERCFQQVVSAWRKIGKAYALCARLEQPEAGNPQFASLMATILHRCLYYTGMVILEHYRARRELPPGIWMELHGFYETAEEWGVACTPIQDALENSLQSSHCAAAYVTLLLIDITCPYSSSTRNLNLVRRWASMWAPLVSVSKLVEELDLPPYIVELMKDAPLHPSALTDDPGSDARYLDTVQIGLQINHMLSQLRQRLTPSQLGLGEETSGHVIQLLEHLTRPWTQLASPRRFRRFPTNGIVRVAIGFEAMHYVISGEEFEQPDSASAYSRGDFDQLFTFRDRAEPGRGLSIKPKIDFPIDQWSVINHSANGFRLVRSSAGQKLMHGQLMAVCPHDGEHFLLVQVSWLMQEENGGLLAGVATLPGMPVAIGARHVVINGDIAERFRRAFLLPPVPAIHEEGSIVLPAGMYQASRVLEVFNGSDIWQLRLKNIRQRGVDFDRISYDPL